MGHNVVWLQIWRPTLAENKVKTIFWRPHRKTVGKICMTTFWASLGKFEQKSFAPPKIRLLLHLCTSVSDRFYFRTKRLLCYAANVDACWWSTLQRFRSSLGSVVTIHSIKNRINNCFVLERFALWSGRSGDVTMILQAAIEITCHDHSSTAWVGRCYILLRYLFFVFVINFSVYQVIRLHTA